MDGGGRACEEIMAKSCGYQRRIRRMSYRGGTVNVGVWEEVESNIDLIHRGSDEIAYLAHRRDEVIQLLSSLRKDPPSLEGSPSVERETNIMTQDELDHLRESHSFPLSVQIKPYEEDETIASTCLSKVAFYEATFHTGLREVKKDPAQGYPNNVKEWKKKFFFISKDDREFPSGISRDAGVPRVPMTWSTPGKRYNKSPILSTTEQERLNGILDSLSAVETIVRISRQAVQLQLWTTSVSLTILEINLAKGASPAMMSTSVAIDEKPPQSEVPDIKPTEKGKLASNAKVKGEYVAHREKEEIPLRTGHHRVRQRPLWQLGQERITSMAEKLIEGVIPPLNKAEENKLELDQAIARLFQGIGEVMVLTSSLASNGREMRDEAIIQQGRSTSIKSEMTHAQKLASDLERQLVEAGDGGGQASKYFGEGFDFYKRQLGYLHPDLDMQDMRIDVDLLEEEEGKEEEKEGEKEEEREEEKEEEKGNQNSPLSP
ncbi:hypothetical protein Acr_00g0075200 [Actinidia rufa]|uniref:Uncharacterized protein n=1 Tax=Actinidia rufa TaxID=165716 RepID=A0A7J0DSL9_9ERIC|nr:hypothetical protein Acr_00g0075200 [Actinidia rufa]